MHAHAQKSAIFSFSSPELSVSFGHVVVTVKVKTSSPGDEDAIFSPKLGGKMADEDFLKRARTDDEFDYAAIC